MSEDHELSELEIKLGESDGFRRSQIIVLCDTLADARGQMAVMRHRIAALEQQLKMLQDGRELT